MASFYRMSIPSSDTPSNGSLSRVHVCGAHDLSISDRLVAPLQGGWHVHPLTEAVCCTCARRPCDGVFEEHVGILPKCQFAQLAACERWWLNID